MVGNPIYPDNTRDSGSTLKSRYDDIAGVHHRHAGLFAPYASNQFDFIPGDVSIANDTITRADHGLFIADILRFTTTSNALPTGLSSGTNYWVIASSLTANIFKVSAASGSTQVDLSATGSGIHTATRTTNMKVAIAKGYNWDGTSLSEIVAQQTALITAPTVNPRIDRLVIGNDAVGSLSIITGAEAAAPVAPVITANKLPVAQIALAVGQTQIVNAD